MAEENLVITLTVYPGESFRGSIVAKAGEPELVFSGWVGFFEAIDVLRQRHRSPDIGNSPDAEMNSQD
jgi:hypothetical protein